MSVSQANVHHFALSLFSPRGKQTQVPLKDLLTTEGKGREDSNPTLQPLYSLTPSRFKSSCILTSGSLRTSNLSFNPKPFIFLNIILIVKAHGAHSLFVFSPNFGILVTEESFPVKKIKTCNPSVFAQRIGLVDSKSSSVEL